MTVDFVTDANRLALYVGVAAELPVDQLAARIERVCQASGGLRAELDATETVALADGVMLEGDLWVDPAWHDLSDVRAVFAELEDLLSAHRLPVLWATCQLGA